jgi:hypothetical protein
MNASGRPNTCKSNDAFGYSGARVSNAYIICLVLGNSLGKLGVIPHRIIRSHGLIIKVLAVRDECASD